MSGIKKDILVDHIQQFMNAKDLPGLAVAAVKDGQVVLSEGFGVRSLEDRSPMTSKNLFHMASVSKPFSATAIMQLVEKGQVSLENRVVELLPYLEMDDDRLQRITLQQLLSHVSGMPDVLDYEWGNPDVGEHALEKYVRSIKDQKLKFDPGSQFAYSNIAFEILGDVISKVSGLTFEEYIKQNIFLPLGMNNSTFLRSEVPSDLCVTPHIRLYQNEVGSVYPYNRAHAPSSTLHSNTEDMSRWMLANLNQGALGNNRILKESSYALLWQPIMRSDEIKHVGLSWFIGKHREFSTIEHGGSDDGFRSKLVMIPDQALGVTVMCNLNPAPVDDLVLGLLDILLGLIPDAPREPVLFPVAEAYVTDGLRAAQTQLRECHAEPDRYDFNTAYFLSLGDVLNDAGKPQQALEMLALGLEIEPQSASLNAGIAWIHFGLKDAENSKAYMQKALDLNPDDQIVRYVQSLLE